nr:unnamed protein product [Callosobruchus analis]
MFVGKYITYA